MLLIFLQEVRYSFIINNSEYQFCIFLIIHFNKTYIFKLPITKIINN